MRRHRRAWLALPLLLAATAASADPPRTLSGGGGTATAGNVQVRTTLGQPLASDQGIGIWYLVVAINGGDVSGVPGAPPVNRLNQNAPNPFNPATTIRFSIAEAGMVRLRLFNLRGQVVAELVDRALPAGEHSLVFRPTRLASGVYFYRLETGGFTQTRRLLLLK